MTNRFIDVSYWPILDGSAWRVVNLFSANRVTDGKVIKYKLLSFSMDMFSNCSIFKLEQIFNPNFLQEIRKIIIAPNLQNGRAHLFPSNVSLFSIKPLSYVIIQFKFSSRCSFSSSLLRKILIPYAIIKHRSSQARVRRNERCSRDRYFSARWNGFEFQRYVGNASSDTATQNRGQAWSLTG